MSDKPKTSAFDLEFYDLEFICQYVLDRIAAKDWDALRAKFRWLIEVAHRVETERLVAFLAATVSCAKELPERRELLDLAQAYALLRGEWSETAFDGLEGAAPPNYVPKPFPDLGEILRKLRQYHSEKQRRDAVGSLTPGIRNALQALGGSAKRGFTGYYVVEVPPDPQTQKDTEELIRELPKLGIRVARVRYGYASIWDWLRWRKYICSYHILWNTPDAPE